MVCDVCSVVRAESLMFLNQATRPFGSRGVFLAMQFRDGNRDGQGEFQGPRWTLTGVLGVCQAFTPSFVLVKLSAPSPPCPPPVGCIQPKDGKDGWTFDTDDDIWNGFQIRSWVGCEKDKRNEDIRCLERRTWQSHEEGNDKRDVLDHPNFSLILG